VQLDEKSNQIVLNKVRGILFKLWVIIQKIAENDSKTFAFDYVFGAESP